MSELEFQNISSNHIQTLELDLFICALGFESRALSIAVDISANCGSKIALGFNHNKAGCYAENKGRLLELDFKVVDDLDDQSFADVLRQETRRAMHSHFDAQRPLRVGVDVSCMNRFRIAALVLQFKELLMLNSSNVEVFFVYSLAKYQAPPSVSARNEVVGPIHPRFAGWFTEPGRPLAIVAGLGYEEEKVVGATEYLQASRIIAMFPVSPILDYESPVRSANDSLLSAIPSGDIVRYSVADVRGTIASLSSVVRGLVETHNVVLLPLGPKLFTVASLFAFYFHRDSSVWRVSGGRRIQSRDVMASEHRFGVRVSAAAKQESLG